MKRFQGSLALGLFACAAGYSQNALAVCQFGTSGEPSLQQSFDTLFGAAHSPNAVNDCLTDGSGPGHDGVWQSTGATSATILLELAGFADSNNLGIYDPSNPASQLTVFGGRLGPNSTAQLAFEAVTGGTRITVSILGSTAAPVSTVFTSDAFGFFLTTPEGNTFFSQSNLNADHADHSYAYRGSNQMFASGAAYGTLFGANDAILAYEDLANGDRDFQDFVMLVRGVEPIPLPAAAWLFASGIAVFGARRRLAAQTDRT